MSQEVDVRVGTITAASVSSFNNVLVGPIVASSFTPILGVNNDLNPLDGQWHHVVVTYTNAASVTAAYIDGEFGASVHTGASWKNLNDITVGCNRWSSQRMGPVACRTSPFTLPHLLLLKWQTTMLLASGSRPSKPELLGNVSRLDIVMNVALLPLTMLNTPYPFRTPLYAETNTLTTTSALNYVQTMTETEPGLIFQGPDGTLQAYSRQYWYLNPTSTTSQAIFSDSANSPYFYDGPSLQIEQDDLDLWTDIQVESGRSGDLSIGSALSLAFGLGISGAQLQTWGPDQSPALATASNTFGDRTLQGFDVPSVRIRLRRSRHSTTVRRLVLHPPHQGQ